MLQQFVGINAIIIYATEIAEEIVPDYKNLVSLVMNFEQTFACLIAVYLLYRMGRKFVILAGTATAIISLCLLGAGFFFT